MAHPVVASIARELLNKSDNERSGVVSTAMSFLGLYRDPLIAANTARSDWRIADLMDAERPVSLYLVVPPSDISRTRPLVRLILNQIARRLTETLQPSSGAAPSRRLLLMLDEFPALGPARLLRDVAGVHGRLWRARLPGGAVAATRSTGPTAPTTPSSTTATCASPSPPTTSARPSACPMRSAPRPSCARRRTCRASACRPGCRTRRCPSRRRRGRC